MIQKQKNLLDRQFITNIVINYIYAGISSELLSFLSQKNSLYVTRIVNYVLNNLKEEREITPVKINRLILKIIAEADIDVDKLFEYTEAEKLDWKTQGRFSR